MSDGHLYLGDGTVSLTGDARTVWYDESHSSVLVMETSSRQLYEISLSSSKPQVQVPRSLNLRGVDGQKPTIARSKSVPVLTTEATDWTDISTSPTRNIVFDFSRSSTRHAPEDPTVLIRMSLDRDFLAVQRSDVEVQIVRVTTGESYWVVCESKRGNRILPGGVLWNIHATAPQSSQDLFLITRFGIEQYRVSPKRRSCALHRTIGVYVHNFWYSAPHSVLIISTSSRANEIVPFAMQGVNVEKMPRLVFSSAVMKGDLYLASLYGELYAVYCDLKASRLLMYRVAKDKVSCVRSWHLMLPLGSAVEFSVVDDLLVCHSVEFSVSFFFDVRCDGGAHDPFSHPLPVSLTPPVPSHRAKSVIHHPVALIDPARDTSEDNEIASVVLGESPASIRDPTTDPEAATHLYHHQHNTQGDHEDQNDFSLSPWQFLSPDRVQRCITTGKMVESRIEIHQLQLNLEQVRRSSAQHPEIIPFLLRRGNQPVAIRLALAIVRERLADQPLSPSATSSLLTAVQTVSALDLGLTADESGNDTSSDEEPQFRFAPRAVVPMSLRKRFFRSESLSSTALSSRHPITRNASGLTLVFQSDFDELVWKPLLASSLASTRAALSSYIIEFIRVLDQSQVPVDSITYYALAKAYLAADQAVELVHQLMHQRGMGDSLQLADLLLRHRDRHPSLQLLALDMFIRLDAYAAAIDLLLELGQCNQAITFAWKHMKPGSCDASIIPGRRFFQSCCRELESHPPPLLVVQQHLHSVLLFLRMWDSESLYGEPSPLASACPSSSFFELLPPAACASWRKKFGFPPVSTTGLSQSAGE